MSTCGYNGSSHFSSSHPGLSEGTASFFCSTMHSLPCTLKDAQGEKLLISLTFLLAQAVAGSAALDPLLSTLVAVQAQAPLDAHLRSWLENVRGMDDEEAFGRIRHVTCPIMGPYVTLLILVWQPFSGHSAAIQCH